jgi:hypothetical protein
MGDGMLFAWGAYCTGGLLHWRLGLLHGRLIARMVFDRGLLTGGILHGMLFDQNLFVGGLLTSGGFDWEAFDGGANSRRLIPGGNCRRTQLTLKMFKLYQRLSKKKSTFSEPLFEKFEKQNLSKKSDFLFFEKVHPVYGRWLDWPLNN